MRLLSMANFSPKDCLRNSSTSRYKKALDPYAYGPPTYKGIAKGMWQFIPETGVKYGLKIGPLQDLGRPDFWFNVVTLPSN